MTHVDVIIPTRNRAATTLAAIGSVRAQTMPDWRLFIVDDASDDDTADQLESFTADDRRITVVRRSTRGMAALARQTAFEAGNSEWVATLDSDDLWHPERLERQLAVAEDFDVVIAWHSWLHADGSSRVTRRPTGSGRVSPLLTSNMDVLLARRSLLDSVGGFVGPFGPLEFDENIEFFIRLLAAANVVVVPHVLAWCRDHGGQRTSDALPASSLDDIISRYRAALVPWPDDLGSILCRAGARHIAEGSMTTGLRRTVDGVRTATSWRRRMDLVRQFAPHAARSGIRRVMA